MGFETPSKLRVMKWLACSVVRPSGEHMGSYFMFSGFDRICERAAASDGLGLRRRIGWVGE